MKCRQCERENPAQARFCLACGARLGLRCPQCGTELPPDLDLRFCFACGARLGAGQPVPAAPARPEPEQAVVSDRRLVTMLFADLVGFTSLSERLDPEDVSALQDAYFTAAAQSVKNYDGVVEKYIGDAVVAVFGVPQAHEDDPERAVHAALAMHAAMRGVNDQVRADLRAAMAPASPLDLDQFTLRLRIGVHTGLVISRVDESGEFTVTGDSANLTSRLQTAAEPETVLVSADTARLVAHAFEMLDLGAIRVKGKAEPVRVFRVLGPAAVRASQRGIAGLDSPLVGREGEIMALRRAVDDLGRGVGGIVTLVGDAGIGKSRLVTELQAWAMSQRDGTAARMQWLHGRCLSYGGANAYALWQDMLRNALGRTLEDAPDTVRAALQQWVERLCPDCFDDVFPYVGQLMTLPLPLELKASLNEMDGEELKRRTFQAIERVLARAARHGPLVLVCEDLHWADASSLELLQRLLALTDSEGLLIIGDLRPETQHTAWRWRQHVADAYHHRHTDFWLQPLSAADSETLVNHLLGSGTSAAAAGWPQLPSRLIERILSQAEGNPFYVEEVLRSLMDSGALAQDSAGHWTVTQEVTRIEIPSTLQGVLRARVDRLPGDTRRVLQLAAVIGRTFLYRVLAALAADGQDLSEKLLTLQRQDLIREETELPELSYCFKHALTREATYNGILKKQRRMFHQQVAETLERLFPDRTEEMLGLLAQHWEGAEGLDKAVMYLQRAGESAAARFANDEAAAYFTRGLQLAPADRTRMRFELLGGREAIFDRQGQRQQQAQDLAQMAQAAAALRDDHAQAQVSLRQANYARLTSDYATALACAHTGVAQAAQAGDPVLEAQGYALIGQALRHQGHHAQAQTWLQQALALAQRLGDRGLIAQASYLAGLNQYSWDHDDSARQYLEQAQDFYRELKSGTGETNCLLLLGTMQTRRGNYGRAITYLEQALEICRRLGWRAREAIILSDLGNTFADAGDYSAAQACHQRNLDIAGQIGDRESQAASLDTLGVIQHHLGRHAEALPFFAQALQIQRAIGYRRGEAFTLTHQGYALLELRSLEAAAAAFNQALAIRAGLGGNLGVRMDDLAGLALVAQQQGAGDQALAHVDEVLAWINAHGADSLEYPVLVYLACGRVLEAAATSDAARRPRLHACLREGYALLQQRATSIQDEARRRDFLTNVPFNRALAARHDRYFPI